MKKVYIIGAFSTKFKKWPEKSHKDLIRDAYLGALNDIGWDNGDDIQFGWFSNVFMSHWNQASIRGQVCFIPLVREKLFPERVPIINVEGACASGSMAFFGAWTNILSGQSDVNLAIGVEKLYDPDAEAQDLLKLFGQCLDNFDQEDQFEVFRMAGEKAGRPFNYGPNRSVFMDTYAVHASYHMWRYGTTQRQIAIAASKNHHNGSLNPNAQYQFEVSVEDVLNDREINYPLTRSMCAPIGDGAAAAILCSEDYLKTLPQKVQKRAVRLRAIGMKGGKKRGLNETSVTRSASQAAFEMAGIGPKDIDIVEAHDACAFSEIYQPEMIGFCPEGKGGEFVESGITAIEGDLPWNTSGGCISKGHPIGATGLSMMYEMTTQLRGEAKERQVKGNPEFGLIDNAGGTMFLDEATCAISILQKDR